MRFLVSIVHWQSINCNAMFRLLRIFLKTYDLQALGQKVDFMSASNHIGFILSAAMLS